MEINTVPQQKYLVDGKKIERPAYTYKRTANRLVLVTLLVFLQLSAQGATAAASTDVQVVGLSDRGAPYSGRRGPSQRFHALRGNPAHRNQYSGRLWEYQHNGRRLISGLFTDRPLAVKGDRVDPTNHLRHYRGGFDVTSKHYWASVFFTGIYGYAIGVAFLLLGLILALLACCRCCGCCRRERSKESHTSEYYWLPRLLVLLLSLFVIGCLIALFVRNKQLYTQAKRVRNTINGAATFATDTVHDVTSTLASVDSYMAKYDFPGLDSLNSTEASLNQQANSITNKVNKNIRKLNKVINIVEIVLIVILSLGLFIIIAGLVPTFLRWRRIFFLIIVLGWILTTLFWILFGVGFALNNVASDTCEALIEYLQAPANTTLDNLLPCVDLATASAAFTDIREGISTIIVEANTTVTTIERFNNRNGGNGSIAGLCNPIGGAPNYTYTGTCANGTLPIGNLPQVLAPYVCLANMTTFQCFEDGRWVSSSENTTLYEFSNGAQSLLNIIPDISNLANCSFVYDTFTTIVNSRCNPAKSALRNLWIPLLLMSIALTFLTLAWLLANHRNTQQKYLGTVYAQNYSPKGRPK